MTSLPEPPVAALPSRATCACRPRGEAWASGARGDEGAHDVADRLGIGVSLTCAVHCAATGALSLVPSLASSTLGASSEALEWVEAPLLVGALFVGLWSLVPSFRNEHGKPWPLALFVAGLAHLFASRVVEGSAEIGLTVLGVGLVALAHGLNLRYCGLSHARPRALEAHHGDDCVAVVGDVRP